MGTVVDAAVRSEQLALRHTFDRLPDAQLEALRVVSCEAGRVLPYVWASAPDDRALHNALESDSSTDTVELLSQQSGRHLYRITWGPSVQFMVNSLVTERGTLVAAKAGNGQWRFQVLFPTHDAASATYDHCRDVGLDLAIGRVKCGNDAIGTGGFGLSAKQGDALAAALEKGYYAVPRRITLKDLSKEIGVSHQALSERLRRGHQVVVSGLLDSVSRPFEPVDLLAATGPN
jgi:predicted DNA binding protein